MNENELESSPSSQAPRMNRSCEECRARKVRCSSAASPGTSRCVRCVRRDLICEFIPVAPRKRRRVDGRIRELERKIESLLPMIGRLDSDVTPGSQATPDGLIPGTPVPTLVLTHPEDSSNQGTQERMDHLVLGLIPTSKAVEFYRYFQQELLPHYPVVFIPSDKADFVMKEKPSLFISIVAAAAASLEPALASVLGQELEKTLAHRAMVDGDKSLELAQALLIRSIWSYPPNTFDRLKFGRYAQMAAELVLELGLPEMLDSQLLSNGIPLVSCGGPEDDIMENSRALVACFLLCSSIALAFRRPSIITFTPVVGKCIAHLKTSLHATPQDKTLAFWAELQHLAEDMKPSLGSMSQPWSADERTPYHLRDSIIRLSIWKRNIEQQHFNESMGIHYYYIRMYAHEQNLYSEYRPEDFKPPYIIRSAAANTGSTAPPNHDTLYTLNDTLLSGSLLLNTFLALTVSDLRTVPVIVYTRMFYAIVIFAKLYTSAQSLDSQFRRFVDVNNLQFESYISRLIAALQEARGPEGFRVPKIFLGMLERLSQWCVSRLQLLLWDADANDFEDEWQPMKYEDAADDDYNPLSMDTSDENSGTVSWMSNFDAVFPFLDGNQSFDVDIQSSGNQDVT